MQRDMDLVRETLLQVDAADGEVDSDDLHKALGGSLHKLVYHLDMLVQQAGLLTGLQMDMIGTEGWIDLKLSWAGHEFLDQIRDPEIWRETKQVAQKAGGFSVDLLGALAKGLIKKQVEKYTGVELEL